MNAAICVYDAASNLIATRFPSSLSLPGLISTRVQAVRCALLGVRLLRARKRSEGDANIRAIVGHESSAISRQYSHLSVSVALTPAMEAELPNHVCPVEEILALLWE